MTSRATAKRQRVVEGSCWPCKQRRIKCDLQEPTCRRCELSGAECNYDKVLLRWNARRNKGALQSQRPGPSLPSDHDLLAVNEKRALDYFRARVWPLLSTAGHPCSPPVSLALRSKPVLQALCIFSEAHRALQERGQSNQTLINRRLSCIAAIRGDLVDVSVPKSALHALLVAVLLLYHSDGFVDCIQSHASTQTHHAGAVAIIQSLGGFHSVWHSSEVETKMLLSEFVTTDLLEAVIRGSRPCFAPTVWNDFETGPVWWERPRHGDHSLANVLGTMSEMTVYLQETPMSDQLLQGKVCDFERALRPSYLAMADFIPDCEVSNEAHAPSQTTDIDSQSLCQAFQHAALMYLYRAICGVPTQHFLVQQHVRACLDYIVGVDKDSKVHNCAVFPLYIAGAHALHEPQQKIVLARLDAIYEHLGFESVSTMRDALQELWRSPCCLRSWTETFRNLAPGTLVL